MLLSGMYLSDVAQFQDCQSGRVSPANLVFQSFCISSQSNQKLWAHVKDQPLCRYINMTILMFSYHSFHLKKLKFIWEILTLIILSYFYPSAWGYDRPHPTPKYRTPGIYSFFIKLSFMKYFWSNIPSLRKIT